MYRTLLQEDFWHKDSKTAHLWMTILLSANWEVGKWNGVTIEPGSFITTYKELVRLTGLTTMEIRHRLNNFEINERISLKSTKGFTSITVLNWTNYQGFEDISESEQRTNNEEIIEETTKKSALKQRVYNKKRNKEIKNNTPPASGTGVIPNEQSLYSFSEPEQVSAVQMMDSLDRWERLLKVWITSENVHILKKVRDQHFLKMPIEKQEELVQYIESLGSQAKYLSNLWIGPLLKSKDFSIEDIRIEIQQKEKFDRTRPKSLKEESVNEPFHNHKYDERGSLKKEYDKFPI
ncbi:hypothetical protein EBU91_05345, partial [bacterium]|nr:hypothetical protein [bacterium]